MSTRVQSGSSHSSPQPLTEPPDNANTDPVIIYSVDAESDPFDPRSSDSPEPPTKMELLLAKFSEIFPNAGKFIREKLGWRELPSINSKSEMMISPPRNFRRRTESLPAELAKANTQAAEIVRAQQQAKQVRADFIEAKDTPLAAQPMFTDTDSDDFSYYLKLCKLNGKKPGEMDCPQNFLPGVFSHAKAFFQLIEQRRQTALDRGVEFTLSEEDQNKQQVLADLLARSHNKEEAKLGQQVLASGKVASVTTTQMTNFHKWREWFHQGQKNELAAPAIDVDAAQVYAKDLLEKYKDRKTQLNRELKEMLEDAEWLLESSELHRILLEDESSSVTALEVTELEAKLPKQLPTDPPITKNPGTETAVSKGQQPGPPPPVSTRKKNSEAKINQDIPDLSSFEEDDAPAATSLFNNFVRLYAQQIDNGSNPSVQDPVYKTPLCVAAANEFLRAASQPMTTSETEVNPLSFAAANFLINEYRKSRQHT